MDMLRLILLFIGLVVIAGIYLYYREPKDKIESHAEDKPSFLERLKSLFTSKADQADDDEEWLHPKITAEDFDELGPMVARRATDNNEDLDEEMHVNWDSATPVAPGDEVVLVFHIMAGKDKQFSGDKLKQAAEQAGFQFGEMQIFHFYGQQLAAEGDAICSMANILEPGYFDPDSLDSFISPGVTLFMQLPGPLEARQTFELTLGKAQEITGLLGGELCDEAHNVLTEQTISHMKEQVESFRFKQQVAAIKQRRH